MIGFLNELWNSIFTPGTTPALIKATHGSFILLIISLIVLVFFSKSIHFINLLIIAVFLYGTVIWFIAELEKIKAEDQLKSKNAEEKKGLQGSVEGSNPLQQELVEEKVSGVSRINNEKANVTGKTTKRKSKKV